MKILLNFWKIILCAKVRCEYGVGSEVSVDSVLLPVILRRELATVLNKIIK